MFEAMDLSQVDTSARHAALADVAITPRFGPGEWRDFQNADLYLAGRARGGAGAVAGAPGAIAARRSRLGAAFDELDLSARLTGMANSARMFTLHIHEGPAAGRTVELVGTMVIGREGADIAVQADTEMSRRHARLRVEGSRVLVEDLGSTNGT